MHRALHAVLAALLCAAAAGDNEDAAGGGGYTVGESVHVQCKDWVTGEWGAGPHCKETGEELQFNFGYDNFLYCGLEVADEKAYKHIVEIVSLEKTWNCRVAMSKARDFFVPFTIPIWGVVEGDHVHVDNHVNFIFHVDDGKIIAAAAYPVRDRFQFGKAGSLISMHGPVRWFHRQAFQSFSGGSQSMLDAPAEGHAAVALASCVLSSLVTLLGAVVLYQRKLKPRLIRKIMKGD